MKNIFLSLIFLSLISLKASFLEAKEIHIQNANFVSSKSNSQYIKFDLVAWKLGMFKSTIHNYANQFVVNYDVVNQVAKNITVNISVKDLDTDLLARNEKMWEYCFDYNTYSSIKIVFTKDLNLSNLEKQKLTAKIFIRGKEHLIDVDVQVEKKSSGYIVHGESVLSLKKLEIPDPSIAVATLEDTVKIYFKIEDK